MARNPLGRVSMPRRHVKKRMIATRVDQPNNPISEFVFRNAEVIVLDDITSP